MVSLKTFESGKEKHLPMIEIKRVGESYEISVEVGREVKHPNEPIHNINWIDVYFHLEGREIVHLARIEFKSHGEFGNFTEPKTKIYVKLEGRGKIVAISYCTLHGLWKAEIPI